MALTGSGIVHSDIVIENFRPGALERWNLGWERLSADNPKLVMVRISGYGQSGPYRDRPGFDQIAQGMSGMMSVTGLPGQGPVRAGAAVDDVTAGLFAALGVLTALLEREVSGEGQWVQSSLLHAGIALLDFQAARYLVKGEVPAQVGNDHPTSIPTSAFTTADGHMNVAAAGEGMWLRLCRAIGREDLLERAEFKGDANRSKNRAALNAELNASLRARPSAQPSVWHPPQGSKGGSPDYGDCFEATNAARASLDLADPLAKDQAADLPPPRLDAELHVDVQISPEAFGAQEQAVGRGTFGEEFLGKRRPVIGQVDLFPDQEDGASGITLPYALHRRGAGQPGAHDHILELLCHIASCCRTGKTGRWPSAPPACLMVRLLRAPARGGTPRKFPPGG